MKIVIVTQDDPFYLGQHFDSLFSLKPPWLEIKGVILLDVSPIGKVGSIRSRVGRIWSVFGAKFFIRYSIRYVIAKTIKRKFLIRNVIRKYNIPELVLQKKNINAKAY